MSDCRIAACANPHVRPMAEASGHHEIKIAEPFADAVLSGDKTFEVRKNDRGYQRGDTVEFVVVMPSAPFSKLFSHGLAGKTFEITYVLSGWGIEQGHVVFGIREVGA